MTWMMAQLRTGSWTWRQEMRAMAVLAWPMVLTNMAQNAMQTVDVMMMGWLGPRALAAGTLGFNMYFTPMIFGMGLLSSVTQMVAFELGRRAHSVRDVRRTVRQGLWIALMAAIPIWVLLWNGESILVAMGQDPELSAAAAGYLRAMQWALLPFYGYVVLRSFVSALERPGWALAIMAVAVVFNAFANWVLMFGNLGFPALGIVGTGIATTLAATLMFAGLALVVILHRRFRRYRIFGRFWRSDWPRFTEMVKLGLPISGILAFEVDQAVVPIAPVGILILHEPGPLVLPGDPPLPGTDGVHVLGGIILLLTLWSLSMMGRLPVSRAETVENVGLYWHFVDIVWIVLFTVVYLIPVDLYG